jgi:tetratricopeptide (TPR) repeat protein
LTLSDRCSGVRIGAFEIESLLGTGGMGNVLGAVHLASRVPVALKVMKGRHGRKDTYRRAFRAEVQAMARLSHPGIIMVLDLGEVDPEVEEATEGALTAGSLWFAMERASGGSMVKLRRNLGFEPIKLLLLSLLDSLAHAHARGVVHRDLKPGNVLLCTGADMRPGVKLTDFGIAHAMRRETRAESREGMLGTPQYMAPEQCRGEFRDYGPWTDLYALGCMAYELSCGRRPFLGIRPGEKKSDPGELVRQHLEAPPPPLEPTGKVPREFEAWVHRLMAKDLAERFRRAADAAWALRFMKVTPEAPAPGLAMGAPTVPIDIGPIGLDFSEDTEVDGVVATTQPEERPPGIDHKLLGVGQTLAVDPMRVRDTGRFSPRALQDMITLDEGRHQTVERGPVLEEPPAMQTWQAPPPPESWRRAHTEPPPRLQDAGERLFGLRTVPLVGRERERDLLWNALLEASETGTARVVMLRGLQGVGKSRLAEWIGQRAHELGNAVVMKSVHSPNGGPADGLPRTVAELLGSHGLARLGLERRAEKVLAPMGLEDPYYLASIVGLVVSGKVAGGGTNTASVRLSTPLERYRVLARLLQHLGLSRPVVLILDDVQWGVDALMFISHILRGQSEMPLPLLVLAVVEDEALAECDVAAAAVREIVDLPGAASLTIGALGARESHRLVGELLGLEPDLEREVIQRAGGNPSFAIQLVADWIDRGLLVRSEGGFRLLPGTVVELPEDIFALWSRRLERLLGTLPADSLPALEVAAVLGQDVDLAEWTWVCHREGLVAPSELVDGLTSAGFATRTEGGLVLSGGMFRESIIRGSKEGDRWVAANRMCADMLSALYAADLAMVAERIGNCLVEASAPEEALEPLLAAARRRGALSEFESGHALLGRREEILRKLGVPKTDIAWAAGWSVRARILTLAAEVEEGQVWGKRAVVSARRCKDPGVLRDALSIYGRVLFRQGKHRESERVFEEALAAFEVAGDDRGVADCLRNLGNIAHTIKNVAAEEEFFHQALEIYEQLGDELGVGMTLKALGAVYRQRGDLTRAKQLYHQALGPVERSGSRLELARLLNGVAEIARAEGQLDTAEKGYKRAQRTYEDVGSKESVVPLANLGIVAVMRGEFASGRAILEEGLSFCERVGLHGFLHQIHTALLPCVAAAGDRAAFDLHYREAESLLAASGVKDVDIASMAEAAGDGWSGTDNARARQSFELSMVQWRWLGRADDVVRVERAIARLGSE